MGRRRVFEVRQLANIAHGAAKLGVFSPDLCRVVDADAERIVTEGISQNITNILYAFATAGQSQSRKRNPTPMGQHPSLRWRRLAYYTTFRWRVPPFIALALPHACTLP